jgi:glycosyltransferase involved in cell wall biosynthesis
MTSEARHTFVVPAYGCSPHLAECLASLQAQTWPSPVVVTTPTPYEGLAALVEGYGARLVVNPAGGGIGRDWNFALAHAKAPWVTVAHQDDLYLPTFVETTLQLADATPRATLVMTGYAELLGAQARAHTPMLWIKRVLLELGFLGRSSVARASSKRRLLRFGCPIPCPSVTLRVDRTGLRFREDLKVNLDWEAWLRLAASPGAFAYSRERLLLHRIHADSETTAGIRGGVRAREDLMLFESLWPKPVARLLARGYALSYAAGGD